MSAARSVTATFNATTPVATIYGDALAADWASWSWSATIDFNGTNPVRVGTRAINVTYQAWGGLSLRKGTAQSTSGYTALKFWVHGGTGAAKSLRVYTQTADSGGESASVVVSAPANTWTEITVSLELARQPGLDQAPQHPGEQRRHAADDDVRRDPPDAVADGDSTASTTPQTAPIPAPSNVMLPGSGTWLSSWSGFQRWNHRYRHRC